MKLISKELDSLPTKEFQLACDAEVVPLQERIGTVGGERETAVRTSSGIAEARARRGYGGARRPYGC